MKVRINTAAIAEFARTTHAFDPDLEKFGAAVSEDAARDAPKSTGHMAESIHHELGHDSEGPYVRISWDKDHWYGFFAEVGTSKETARPFLRPAVMKRRSL